MHKDLNRYIKLFKDEAREYLGHLDELVLKIEKEPDNRDLISEIFRIFHTLKGMAASLGYKEIESISHDLEERLEGFRESRVKINKGTIDLIFNGIDKIEFLLENIGKKEEGKEISKVDLGQPFIKIILREDVNLPAARAAVIIKQIKEKTEILEMKPNFEQIKSGYMGNTFLVKCSDPDTVKEIVSSVSEVKDISLVYEELEGKIPRSGIGGIRVNVELLDRLQNIVGELVVSTTQMSSLLKRLESDIYKRMLETHNRSVKELQEIVTNIRLVPLSLIFNKFPRYIRDLSDELNKKVQIDIFGSDIEVDRSLLEGISDPMIHLIRNAVAHGIESPQDRKKSNKPETGKVGVIAKRAKGDIIIEVSDDGKGIDEKDVLNMAYNKGLVKESEVDTMTRKEIMRFLFIPGFTTDKKVSEVSGRGVGLDVVKNVVRSVGGSVDITTEKGVGTKISMKMPLSMAIIRVYLVNLSSQSYALPMTFVDETIMIPRKSLSYLMGKEIMLLRKEILPVYRFSDIMGSHGNELLNDSLLSCVIVEVEGERFALIVDSFKGSSDAVVKPLPVPLDKIKEYTGITIIGDGKPCLILDLPSFRYRRQYENTGS